MAEYDAEPSDAATPETPESRAQRLIQRAKDCVQRSEEAMSDNRREAVQDLRYKAGAQWPATVSTAREAEQRPCLVLNKILVKQLQITNDYAQNPPGIEVHPVNEQAHATMAHILEGLLRHIAYGSSGQSADKLAFESAVDIGWGYLRLRTEYVSDTSFDQRLVVDALPDTLSVYFDANSRALDGSDAEECVIVEQMPRATFERLYPDAEATATAYVAEPGLGEDWLSEDAVRVAEYYCCEYTQDRLLRLRSGQAVLESQLQDPRLLLLATQVGFSGEQRPVQRKQIKWYKLTAVDLLDERTLPGPWIPVVPVYGNTILVDGERKHFGSIRFLRDPQQILNYAETTNVELVGLQPRAPWVGPEGFMSGHETEWKNSNNSNVVALEYAREGLDGLPITEPPQRVPFPAPPMALIEMKQAASQYIDEISGIGQPVQLTPGSQRSQVSIREQDSQASMATYHYFDHAKISMLHAHKILLAWIPVYYTAPQVVQLLGLDGRAGLAAVNQPELVNGVQQITNDVTVGEYAVRLATGPSYDTQRQEASEKLVAIGTAYPELWAKAGSDIIRTFNVPGGDRIAAKLAVTEPQVPGIEVDAETALAQTQAQLQQVQQEAQALNTVAQQLEQQAKDLTEQNRTLRLAAATLEAERRGERAEADVVKRQDALKLEAARLAQQEKELQLTAQIARLQSQLAQQQYKTTVAQNGADDE